MKGRKFRQAVQAVAQRILVGELLDTERPPRCALVSLRVEIYYFLQKGELAPLALALLEELRVAISRQSPAPGLRERMIAPRTQDALELVVRDMAFGTNRALAALKGEIAPTGESEQPRPLPPVP